MSGRVERIWVKRTRQAVMAEAHEVRVKAGKGIVGNADQGGWRQVTIMAQERWNALMRQVGASLDPSARRANLLVSGIDLEHSRGRTLQIGDARLRIRGETRPCQQMDQAAPGLRKAMRADWSGGVFAEVLTDGSIAVGDAARWADAADDALCESSRP